MASSPQRIVVVGRGLAGADNDQPSRWRIRQMTRDRTPRLGRPQRRVEQSPKRLFRVAETSHCATLSLEVAAIVSGRAA